MNKKTYINPELEVIKIQTQQMLALSGVGVDTTDTPINAGDVGTPSFVDMDELDIVKNF